MNTPQQNKINHRSASPRAINSNCSDASGNQLADPSGYSKLEKLSMVAVLYARLIVSAPKRISNSYSSQAALPAGLSRFVEHRACHHPQAGSCWVCAFRVRFIAEHRERYARNRTCTLRDSVIANKPLPVFPAFVFVFKGCHQN